jgi:hypothetical protein
VNLCDRGSELTAVEEVSFKDIVEGRMGAFERRRADGLLPDRRACEQPGIRQSERSLIEASDSDRRLGDRQVRLLLQIKLGR